MVDILARDIAAGIRDGLSRADASEWAWSANPNATWGDMAQAFDIARTLQPRTQSPLTRAAITITQLKARGVSAAEAGANLWQRKPYLTSKQIAQALKRATIISREIGRR